MWDLVNDLLDSHELKLRENQHNLSLLVGASLGKAMKTFWAIKELCLLGCGEDALILLRANVNLVINLRYILTDSDPAERATDFIAYGYRERVRYMRDAHGADYPSKLAMSETETKQRAEQWKSVSIKARAERLPELHYKKGYTFYSSFEHADPMALDVYIADWNEAGVQIDAAPSDANIEVALAHSATVLADVISLVCTHFEVGESDILPRVSALLAAMEEHASTPAPTAPPPGC
jgi:hypothetical protein